MRRIILICFVLCASLAWTPQEKEKDLIATTDDGRKVLLKADGTWEFIKTEIIKEWREIARWKGSGIKNTEPFTISTKEWRISWTTKGGQVPGIFSIMVYKGDSEVPDIAAQVQGDSTDSSYMRGAGQYRLTITSSQRWEVTIEEKIK